jgi:hypothetical protein
LRIVPADKFRVRLVEDNFIGIGGLGMLGRILTLGLSTFLDRALQRRAERELAKMRVTGPDPIWPFPTVQDYHSSRQQ